MESTDEPTTGTTQQISFEAPFNSRTDDDLSNPRRPPPTLASDYAPPMHIHDAGSRYSFDLRNCFGCLSWIRDKSCFPTKQLESPTPWIEPPGSPSGSWAWLDARKKQVVNCKTGIKRIYCDNFTGDANPQRKKRALEK